MIRPILRQKTRPQEFRLLESSWSEVELSELESRDVRPATHYPVDLTGTPDQVYVYLTLDEHTHYQVELSPIVSGWP
jgi:hypothetical protein